MKNPQKDYTQHGWIAVVVLIALLIGISFVPPQSIGGVKLRRANILSDLVQFDDSPAPEESVLFNEADFHVDMEAVAETIVADTMTPPVESLFEWRLDTMHYAHVERLPDTLQRNATRTPIELLDAEARFDAFCDTLLTAKRPVRIAFLGDSFIEGDILTADLREQLQASYGGGGTGFAPVASPLTAFRRTIKTQSKGWTAYNIMQRKSAPQAARDNFYISGWVCQPESGASTRWQQTDFRKRLDSCRAARFFFISPENSTLEVRLNDTLKHQFAIEGHSSVRQILVTAPQINSIEYRIIAGNSGFLGYGAIFEDRSGVVVDNYSVRSNNGQAMFWSNASVNAQINAFAGYDLVILQYGLNIMQQGVHGYANYGAQIEKMVAYVQQCFPTAAVLVLGVSDRSAKTENGFEPMDAIPYMIACQRDAARNAGAAFWNTSEAMRSLGGMAQFVASGWAGKDYTHINYAGGRRIAWSLADALNALLLESTAAQRQRLKLEEQAPIVDTLKHELLRKELLPEVIVEPYNSPRQ